MPTRSAAASPRSLVLAITVSRNRSELDIENTAVFGLIGYDFNDAWSITLEGRYAEEDIDLDRDCPGPGRAGHPAQR